MAASPDVGKKKSVRGDREAKRHASANFRSDILSNPVMKPPYLSP